MYRYDVAPPWAPVERSAGTISGMPTADLSLRTERVDDTNVLYVSGELDLSTVKTFDVDLEQLHGDRLVVELTDCSFIDSSALRSLFQAHRRAGEGGHAFVIVVSPDTIARRVLEIAAMDRVLPVRDTLADALESAA